MVIGLAAGCQSESTPSAVSSSSSPVAKPLRQRPLATATISDPKTFNPLLVTDTASGAAIGKLFDTLVRLNELKAEMEPHLAEQWECSADGLRCTFFLRHDVRWHDGAPFTADDVVFTFDAIYDDRVPNSFKHILTIDGTRIEIVALDRHTVEMRLPRPFAPLINSIAVPIIPRHRLADSLTEGTFVQEWGIDTPPAQLIGTGPFRMVEFEPAQYIRLRRDPNYWMRDEVGKRLPHLDTQTILIVPNQDTAYLKFLAGETDTHECRPEEVPELQQRSPKLGIEVPEIGLDTGQLFVTFNRNPRNYKRKDGKRDPRLTWFTDRRFLRAIAHAIDKESIIISCPARVRTCGSCSDFPRE